MDAQSPIPLECVQIILGSLFDLRSNDNRKRPDSDVVGSFSFDCAIHVLFSKTESPRPKFVAFEAKLIIFEHGSDANITQNKLVYLKEHSEMTE